jgi:hypothetical protein
MLMVLDVTPVVLPAVEAPPAAAAVVDELTVVEVDFEELPQALAAKARATRPAIPPRHSFGRVLLEPRCMLDPCR